MWLLLAGLLHSSPAWAAELDDPTWFAGRVVASVELYAGEGELPEADLEPLLRARQGQPLDPATLQLDLRTLYRVAPLNAAEADVVRWPVYDERVGDLVEGVKVRYVVYPATRVAGVRVQGAGDVSARKVAGSARLAEGDIFEPEHDSGPIGERVRGFLVGEGYPEARVEVEAYPADADDPFALEVWLRVDEGPPRMLRSLTIDGVPVEVGDKRVRRWARRAGLKEGRPLAEDAVTRARLTVRQRLGQMRNDAALDEAVGPRTAEALASLGVVPDVAGGWVEARVFADVTEVEGGERDVALSIDAGPRTVLQTEGISYRVAREALGIDARLRLTRGWLEQADDKIVAALQRRGFLDATASVTLEERDDARVLSVIAEEGRRHRRRPLVFEGNETLSTTQLRTVFNQASPDVLRRRRYTADELQRGLDAAEALYRSVGHDRATLRSGEPLVTRRFPGLHSDRSRRFVAVGIRVDEGPLTRLTGVGVTGASPEVDLSELDAVLEALRGEPFSPQGLQALAQRIVDAHRGAGYLESEARVRADEVRPAELAAVIQVRPGPRILLRSFATRGNRRVSSRFIRRTVAPPLGAPLTAQTLDDIRQRLYDLGMFSSLELSLLGDGAARDLVIDLRERRRHTVEVGFGLASDQGVRALGRWTVRNIFGPADRIDVNALLGIRFASGSGALGFLPAFRAPEYRLGSAYSTPLSRRSRLTISLIGQEEVQQRNWRSLRRAIGVQWEVAPGRTSVLQLGARLAHLRLADADPGALLANDVWADNALALPADPSVDTRGRVVDDLELVWLDDRRDDPLRPTRGLLFQARTAFTPSLIQPGYAKNLRVPSVAVEARTSAVIPLGPLSLRLNAEGGHQRVIPLGSLPQFTVDEDSFGPAVPVEKRYRLGGTASLRGFRRDGVGPQQQTRQLDLDWPDALDPVVAWGLREDDTRWVPTGGDTYALGTADLLIPLPVLGLSEWDGYAIALFADVGQVWFAVPTPRTGDDAMAPVVRIGTGLGLRILTPVGPLQADLAVNPQAALATGEREKLLRESWEEPRVRLHLSLGTLF